MHRSATVIPPFPLLSLPKMVLLRSVKRLLLLPALVVLAAVHTAVPIPGQFAYVTNGSSASVSVIDLATNTVTRVIPVGSRPTGIAIPPGPALRVTIEELLDIARECDSDAQTATVNFIVTIDGDPPAGSKLIVIEGTQTLLTTIATSGDHGVGPHEFPIGGSIIQVSLVDDQNEELDATNFQINVADTIAPILNGVFDQVIECNDDQTILFPMLLGIFASDDCDASPEITFSPADVGLGTTPVTVTVTDITGNTTTASFSLTVQDTTPPVFDLFPTDILRECDSPAGALVSFSVGGIDASALVLDLARSGSRKT